MTSQTGTVQETEIITRLQSKLFMCNTPITALKQNAIILLKYEQKYKPAVTRVDILYMDTSITIGILCHRVKYQNRYTGSLLDDIRYGFGHLTGTSQKKHEQRCFVNPLTQAPPLGPWASVSDKTEKKTTSSPHTATHNETKSTSMYLCQYKNTQAQLIESFLVDLHLLN